MIELWNLHKRFGPDEVLRGLSLKMESGRIGLVLGPNGGGKTTALRVAAGVLREDGGAIRFEGADVGIEDRRLKFAYLPQSVAFHPRLDARQLLAFYARVLGIPHPEITPALRLWGLEEHAGKSSAALSGGLRQRLGLAVISLWRAGVMLLDEPDISLDAEWRERMQDWLRQQAREGRTVLVATHLLAEWDGRADRAFLCADGRIEDELDPSGLRGEGRIKVRASAPQSSVS